MIFPPTAVDRSGTGKISFNPNNGVFSTMYPIAGLTQSGIWIPFQVDSNGAVIVSTTPSTPSTHFDDFSGDTIPGGDVTLIDVTVPAGVARVLSRIFVVTRVTGSFGVYADNILIGSGRTGPGCFGLMEYTPGRTLAPGTEYQVIFTARDNSPVQSVECYVQAEDIVS